MNDNERRMVERMVRRLPDSQGTSVRRAARAFLDGVPVCEPDVWATLDSVCAPSAARWREYALACWVLSQIEPPARLRRLALGPLCAIVEGDKPTDWFDGTVTQCAIWTNVASIGMGLAGASIAFGILGADISVRDNAVDKAIEAIALTVMTGVLTAIVSSLVMLALSVPFVTPMLIQSRKAQASCAREWAIRTLGRWRRPSALGVVARAAQAAGQACHSEAADALRQILPAVTETDYGSIRAIDQTALAGLLSSPLTTDIKLLILDALAYIGGNAVLSVVSDIAAGHRDGILAERALLVLPRIEQRARMERDSSRLLRAVPHRQGPATFVRPVNRPESDPEFLVRTAEAAPETG